MRYNEYNFIAFAVSPFITKENVVKLIESGEPLDWEEVAKISGAHSIVQALYPALVEKDVVDYVPDEFLNYIRNLTELNHKRNLMMRVQLVEAVTIINKCGIKPLLMKGAAHLFLDTFANISDRLLTDLDILVPSEEIERVSDALIRFGYQFSGDHMEFIQTHHHYPPLIKRNERAMIELHRGLIWPGYEPIFPTDYAWEHSIDIALPNSAEAKVLEPTYRIFHSFLHSCIVDGLYSRAYAEIRQLHELARTQFEYSSDIHWDEILSYAHAHGVGKQFRANLYAAVKFMGVPEFKEMIDRNEASIILHHYRLCSKLKYGWYDTLDGIAYRVIRRLRSIFR